MKVPFDSHPFMWYRIWAGSIVSWDDIAIRMLNPSVLLPHASILLALEPGINAAIASSFKKALSSFSMDFSLALQAANNSFDRMAPAIEGRAYVSLDQNSRMQYVKVSLCSLSLSFSLSHMHNLVLLYLFAALSHV